MTDNTSTRPAVASITQAEIEDGKMMAILAYILFLIPLLAARDKKICNVSYRTGNSPVDSLYFNLYCNDNFNNYC